MLLQYLNNWQLLSISFGLMLLVSFKMMLQSRNFYTYHVTKRKFSMMELEIPATPLELVKIIKGLFELPEDEKKKSVSALKGQLWIDFIYMPLAYGSIFLICWRVSAKLETHIGYYVFLGFAVAQIIPWLCDIIENIYLLQKIKEGINVKPTGDKQHKAYLIMEGFKWGISLTATICAISAICYFWLAGDYSVASFKYMLIIIAEVIVFALLVKYIAGKKPE